MKKVATLLVMNGLIAGTLLADTSAAGASMDQWFLKKHGRATPVREAEIREDQASRAFRAQPVQRAPEDWIENHQLRKLGRNTPIKEAELQNSGAAFRSTAPVLTEKPWMDQWFEKKFGRTLNR